MADAETATARRLAKNQFYQAIQGEPPLGQGTLRIVRAERLIDKIPYQESELKTALSMQLSFQDGAVTMAAFAAIVTPSVPVI
jgi:hypothetical protein